MRRSFLLTLRAGIAVILAAECMLAGAQPAYPTRPIKVLVGVPPGGSTNTVARLVADWLQSDLGQPVVVENRPGANTAVAADAVARSTPDGYTVLLANDAHISLPLLTKLTYDPIKDFIPVSTIGVTRYVVAVNPSVPAKTLKELIAYVKAHPGQMNFGSSGNGGGSHFVGEVFNQVAGLHITHIPYKGAGPALTDLIAGQVQVAYNTPLAIAQQVQAGKIRALAITGPKRVSLLPEVPSAVEAGLPGLDMEVWFGVFVPARTPQPVVDRLNAAIVRMLATPKVKETLEAQGIEPMASTPEQFTARMRIETAHLQKVIKAANIKID